MGGEGKVYTLADVSQHNNPKDCWLIIDGKVYDVTKFLEDHPGGDDVLLSATDFIKFVTGNEMVEPIQQLFLNVDPLAMPDTLQFKNGKETLLIFSIFSGPKTSRKDATDDFEDVGHSSSARAMMDEFYVGDIDTATIPSKVKYTPPKQPHYNQDKTSEFIIKLLQFLVPLIILGVAVGIRFYTKKSA